MRHVALYIGLFLFALALTAAPPRDGGERGGGGFWEHFSERFDADQDGTVTSDEYEGRMPFERLDGDGDGVLTEADFEGFRGGAWHHRRGGANPLLTHADGDEDGAVSRGEWDALLASLDSDGDGVFAPSELAALRPEGAMPFPAEEGSELRGPMRRLDADGSGTLDAAELTAIFEHHDRNEDGVLTSDELSHRGPRHGARASRRGGPGGNSDAMAGRVLIRAADGDRDGGVSSSEWAAFLDTVDPEADGTIDEGALRESLIRPRSEGQGGGPLTRMLDRNGNSILERSDLEAAFGALDTDGDGALAAGELPRGRRGGPHGRRGPR